MKFIEDLEMRGKLVLLRAVLNVPMKNGEIQDHFRIEAMLPTIKYCHEAASKTVIIAHLGRPNGNWNEKKHSLKPVAERMSKLLGKEVLFYPDCRGEETKKFIEQAPEKAIILLENVRKYKEERDNDENFGKELAEFGDVFVQDAFGDIYGEYASVMWPPQVLPHAIGFRIKYEMESLDRLKNSPKHPYIAIVGGTKIKEKMGALKAIARHADYILVGGGIANTMYAAEGFDVKESFIQTDEVGSAKLLLTEFPEKIILPHDVLVAKKKGDEYDESSVRETLLENIEDGESILDIGPETLHKYKKMCKDARDIFWAGTMGYFEWPPASNGSSDLGKALVKMDNYLAIGGGETATVFDQAKIADKVDYISTGGGAALHYLAGEELPGLSVIT